MLKDGSTVYLMERGLDGDCMSTLPAGLGFALERNVTKDREWNRNDVKHGGKAQATALWEAMGGKDVWL